MYGRGGGGRGDIRGVCLCRLSQGGTCSQYYVLKSQTMLCSQVLHIAVNLLRKIINQRTETVGKITERAKKEERKNITQ